MCTSRGSNIVVEVFKYPAAAGPRSELNQRLRRIDTRLRANKPYRSLLSAHDHHHCDMEKLFQLVHKLIKFEPHGYIVVAMSNRFWQSTS